MKKDSLPGVLWFLTAGAMVSLLLAAAFWYWTEYFGLTTSLGWGKPIGEEATVAEKVVLGFAPRIIEAREGEEVWLGVYLESLEQEVVGADVALEFDPLEWEFVESRNGDCFPDPAIYKETNLEEGKMLFSVGSLEAFRGKGELLDLKMRVLAEPGENLSLVLGEESQVALLSLGKGISLEKKALQLKVLKK